VIIHFILPFLQVAALLSAGLRKMDNHKLIFTGYFIKAIFRGQYINEKGLERVFCPLIMAKWSLIEQKSIKRNCDTLIIL